MSKVPISCHPSVWSRLMAISGKRQTAKNREGELVAHRKVIEEDLARKGFTQSPERTKLCVDHWDTVSSIAYQRALIKQLADKLEETIEAGINGKLFESNDDLVVVEEEEPVPPLYSKSDDGDETNAPPVGEKPEAEEKPAAPAAAKSDADAPTWHGFKLDTLGLAPKSIEAMRDAGLITLGDVVKFRDERPGASRLTKLGVSSKDESIVEEAIRTNRDGKPYVPPREDPKQKKGGRKAAAV